MPVTVPATSARNFTPSSTGASTPVNSGGVAVGGQTDRGSVVVVVVGTGAVVLVEELVVVVVEGAADVKATSTQ